MPYLADRQHVLHDRDLVAVIGIRRRRARSRVILRDNGLYHTLTRPRTLSRRVNGERRQPWWVSKGEAFHSDR